MWGPKEEEERRRDLSCGKIEGLKRKAEGGTYSVVVYVLAATPASVTPTGALFRLLHFASADCPEEGSLYTGTQKKEI